MKQVNVHEAKTELSRLLELVEAGERVIIARAGRPVAVLSAYLPQQASEARSQANRIDADLIRVYDSLWKYDFADVWAVVDLRLTPDELWQKFQGTPQGIAKENVAGSGASPAYMGQVLPQLANRFAGALVVFGVAILVLSRWRGERAFTMRCVKCGLLSPFDAGLFELKANRYRPERTRFVHKGCTGSREDQKPRDADAVPARFLLACREGHLDDFPWHWFVHGGLSSCRGSLRFFESGASLQTERYSCRRMR